MQNTFPSVGERTLHRRKTPPYYRRINGVAQKPCLVISPIGEKNTPIRKKSDLAFRYIIKPAAKACGYDAFRPDHMDNPGLIDRRVIELLRDAPMVIADLTDRNPNVFYELALRHALQKPVVQMIALGQKLPFDVHSVRTIEYDLRNPDSLTNARQELIKSIRAFDRPHASFSTPLTGVLDLCNNGNGTEAGDKRPAKNALLPVHAADIHHFVHKARDLAVTLLRPCTGDESVGPEPRHPKGPFRPVPALEAHRAEIIAMLTDLGNIFRSLVPAGTNVWTSLRDRRADDHYHTFERAGGCNPQRGHYSKPLHKDRSRTIRALKNSFDRAKRCVIVTGSAPKFVREKLWEPQPNDGLSEDLSVLMGAVVAKSWDEGALHIKKLAWVVCVCADREDAFNESHIPLLQCCIDALSVVVNVLVRAQAPESGINRVRRRLD